MIGFFDSGVGGLTISEEVHKQLPPYSSVYLGDVARAPYGNKTHEELVQYLKEGSQWLFNKGCELIIVACNSASASALREVQQIWLLQFEGKRILGVIRPSAEEVVKRGFKKVLILGTVATVNSGAYVREIYKIDPSIQITSHACPNWGPMVEKGLSGTAEMREEVFRELNQIQNIHDFDVILLACTHYPYVASDVEEFVQGNVPVFSQGILVARSLEDYLKRHPEIDEILEKESTHTYFTTGDPDISNKIASDRFGFNVEFKTCKIYS